MIPRRPDSLKWTKLPTEFLQQIKEVFHENFITELENVYNDINKAVQDQDVQYFFIEPPFESNHFSSVSNINLKCV